MSGTRFLNKDVQKYVQTENIDNTYHIQTGSINITGDTIQNNVTTTTISATNTTTNTLSVTDSIKLTTVTGEEDIDNSGCLHLQSDEATCVYLQSDRDFTGGVKPIFQSSNYGGNNISEITMDSVTPEVQFISGNVTDTTSGSYSFNTAQYAKQNLGDSPALTVPATTSTLFTIDNTGNTSYRNMLLNGNNIEGVNELQLVELTSLNPDIIVAKNLEMSTSDISVNNVHVKGMLANIGVPNIPVGDDLDMQNNDVINVGNIDSINSVSTNAIKLTNVAGQEGIINNPGCLHVQSNGDACIYVQSDRDNLGSDIPLLKGSSNGGSNAFTFSFSSAGTQLQIAHGDTVDNTNGSIAFFSSKFLDTLDNGDTEPALDGPSQKLLQLDTTLVTIYKRLGLVGEAINQDLAANTLLVLSANSTMSTMPISNLPGSGGVGISYAEYQLISDPITLSGQFFFADPGGVVANGTLYTEASITGIDGLPTDDPNTDYMGYPLTKYDSDLGGTGNGDITGFDTYIGSFWVVEEGIYTFDLCITNINMTTDPPTNPAEIKFDCQIIGGVSEFPGIKVSIPNSAGVTSLVDIENAFSFTRKIGANTVVRPRFNQLDSFTNSYSFNYKVRVTRHF